MKPYKDSVIQSITNDFKSWALKAKCTGNLKIVTFNKETTENYKIKLNFYNRF